MQIHDKDQDRKRDSAKRNEKTIIKMLHAVDGTP